MTAIDRLRDEAAARWHLAHLLGTDGENDVVLTRGDRQCRVAHRFDPGSAVRRDARDRNGKEVERVGDESAGVSLVAVQHRLVTAEPGSLEPPSLDLCVSERQGYGFEHHVGEALVEVFTELDDAAADDGDLPTEPALLRHGGDLLTGVVHDRDCAAPGPQRTAVGARAARAV